MGEVLDLAEKLWRGEEDTYSNHPFRPPFGIEKVAEATYFYKGFSNTIIRETNDGLIMVDPGSFADSSVRKEAVRTVTDQGLNTAVYTHGHVDHVYGVGLYKEEAEEKGWSRPVTVAHEALPSRFRRYAETLPWNGIINIRQFRGASGRMGFPGEYYYPDITYTDRMDISVGGVSARLRHSRGETDDHTWVFFPDTKVLCTGDLFIWAIPNGGNPQKVQRYAKDWAVGLRQMQALEPEVLLPGHGWPIIGADRVRQALDDTAAFMESVHGQTLALMNEGASLDRIIHAVKGPAELLEKPYLQPVYDETEFIVRNIYRFYGGWYDGTPTHLKPAPEKAQADEIARLAGGAGKLMARAEELLNQGDLRMACHLAEWAHAASPDDSDLGRRGGLIFEARAKAEPSTMAMGIFVAAARDMAGDIADKSLDHGIFAVQADRAAHGARP